jgi:hypothetical protein
MTAAKKEKTKIAEVPPQGEKKPHKKPAPVKFYALVQVEKPMEDGSGMGSGVVENLEVEADKKSDLFAKLSELRDPTILMIVRGRRVNLTQKVSWKI